MDGVSRPTRSSQRAGLSQLSSLASPAVRPSAAQSPGSSGRPARRVDFDSIICLQAELHGGLRAPPGGRDTVKILGVKPWLPGAFGRSKWWTQPVRAERLAALRIGVGLVLLFDILFTYLPSYTDFFGVGSVSAPGSYATASFLEWHRSLLMPVESPDAWLSLLLVWTGSAVCLTLGIWPRAAATVAWFFSVSLITVNPNLHN